MRNAADGVKRITLELGGKSPNIVLADANLDEAVKGAANGIFYGKGEVCAAGSRLFVEKKIHDDFMQKLVDRANKLKPGDPLDPKTRLGAIVSEQQMKTVLSYIEAGNKEGAKLVAGGKRASVDGSKGYFLEPTIFDSVDNKMKIAQEEIFGPVLATIPFDDVEQVAEQANQNIYGLAAAIWTNDVRKAHSLARRLKAGTIWINAYNFYDPALPFGGYKQSGFGRELGMRAIEHYTELKSVWLNL
jgi:acyl-CoA reductase-like NAD-dependent aldehyde dehydrogenase